MKSRSNVGAPPVLLGLAVFGALLIILGRGIFSQEDPPVFLSGDRSLIHVALGPGFARPGVYQFSDGVLLSGVISLTHQDLPADRRLSSDCPDALVDGMSLEISLDDKKNSQIQCDWMPASHRIALGVRLHPDRMSTRDWLALPGIGEILAERIEADRQNNGEFGRIEGLVRVKGIGQKRIKTWREFF